MRTFNYQLIPYVPSADQSNPPITGDMSASIISNPVLLDQILLLSLQCTWTGSPIGILKIQASNNQSGTILWTDIYNMAVQVSGPSSCMFDLDNICYSRLQVVYTPTSGTGQLTITANGKGV